MRKRAMWAIAVVVVVVLASITVYSNASSTPLSPWAYRYLVPVDRKIALINKQPFAREGEQIQLGIGAMALYIPYTDEWVRFGETPNDVRLVKGGPRSDDPGVQLVETEPGTFLLDSSHYPIRIRITVVPAGTNAESGQMVKVAIEAERRPK